jgi:hypothetical protein
VAAISSTVPRRPIGVTALMAASSPPTPRMTGASVPRIDVELARSSVWIGPGQIAFTVTPRAAAPTASWRVSPTTPCLEAT